MSELSAKEYTKLKLDEEKIRNLKAAGHEHIYSYDTWVVWTGNNYIKSCYDVRLPDGEIIEFCTPNGGKMNAPDGRKWTEDDKVEVRLSKSVPY